MELLSRSAILPYGTDKLLEGSTTGPNVPGRARPDTLDP